MLELIGFKERGVSLSSIIMKDYKDNLGNHVVVSISPASEQVILYFDKASGVKETHYTTLSEYESMCQLDSRGMLVPTRNIFGLKGAK